MDHRESPAQSVSLHLPDKNAAVEAAAGSKQVRVQLELVPVDTCAHRADTVWASQLQAWLSKSLDLARGLGRSVPCTTHPLLEELSLHAGRWGGAR